MNVPVMAFKCGCVGIPLDKENAWMLRTCQEECRGVQSRLATIHAEVDRPIMEESFRDLVEEMKWQLQKADDFNRILAIQRKWLG